MVLPAGAELIEDVKNAPDHILSFSEPLKEVCTMLAASTHTNTVTSVPSVGPYPSYVELRGYL